MTPPRRRDVESKPLHVIANAVAGDVLFPDEGAFSVFFDALGEAFADHGVRVGQICLMTTHYHALVRADADSLSAALRDAHAKLAWLRNHDDERRGRVFGRRYAIFPIEDTHHLGNVVRYIPFNPVRAGMVAEPSDWRWSTHRSLTGSERPPTWLDLRQALLLNGFLDARSYERFVATADGESTPPLTTSDLVAHRICVLARGGISDQVIAEMLSVPIRRVRTTLRDAGVTWHQQREPASKSSRTC